MLVLQIQLVRVEKNTTVRDCAAGAQMAYAFRRKFHAVSEQSKLTLIVITLAEYLL